MDLTCALGTLFLRVLIAFHTKLLSLEFLRETLPFPDRFFWAHPFISAVESEYEA